MNTYIYYFNNDPHGLIESESWDTALIELCDYFNAKAEFMVNTKMLTFSHSLTEQEITDYEIKYGIK